MNRLRHQYYKNENNNIKSTWYNWLVKNVPELLDKRWVVLKTKLRVFFFKTNTTENYSKLARVTNVYGGRKKLRKPKIKKNSQKTQ